MQVETIYAFKNYLYIAHPVSSHKTMKQSREDLSNILGAFFSSRAFWIWDDCSQQNNYSSRARRALDVKW